MMKKIIFICVMMLGYITLAQTIVTKKLGDFSVLKVYNGIDLELIKSDEQKLEITGEKSERVKIKSVNDILKLSLPFSLKPENNYSDGKVLVKLYYNTAIDVIDANEGATITGKDFKQDLVEVNAQERAFINLSLTTTYLKVRTSSGGIIKLFGTTDTQEVDVDLYGVYHGFEMKTKGNTIVKAGTGAKAEILAGQTLSAKVSFGGSIFYKGDPKVIKDKKVIGGIIKKKN